MLGEAPLLQRLELDLALHAHDLPLQAHRAATLQHHAGEAGVGPLEPLQRLRFEALLGLADPAADAALANLPTTGHDKQNWALFRASQLARHRYNHTRAILLLLTIDTLSKEEAVTPFRIEALDLAERISTTYGDIKQAQSLRKRIRHLLLNSSDPNQVRLANQEPWRLWQIEIGANREAIAELAQLRRQNPPNNHIDIALALSKHANSTALAYGLLQELRRSEAIGVKASVIPKPDYDELIPEQLWLLRRHPGDTAALLQIEAGWRKDHPTWKLNWLDHDLELATKCEPLPPLVQAAMSCLNDPTVRGDLLRLARIWQFGGVSVCWNTRSQKPLSTLIEACNLVLVQDADGALGLDLIAATPRHPFVHAALEQICRNTLLGEGFSHWDISGPPILSGVFARWSQGVIATGLLPAGLRIISIHELRHWLGLGLHLPPPAHVKPEPHMAIFNHSKRRAALASLGCN
ncbi:MAG: hypothetical protein ACK5JJ_09890 [Cyanobacteriota bacterium]